MCSNQVESDTIPLKGARHGCVLPPDLYNLFKEYNIDHVKKKQLSKEEAGTSRISATRTILFSWGPAKETSNHCSTAPSPSEKKGSTARSKTQKKTKLIVVTKKKKEDLPHRTIMAGFTRLENPEKFNFNAKHDSKIAFRIFLATKAFNELKSFLRSRGLSSDVLRNGLVAYVFSIATYICETWCTSAQMVEKLSTFDKRCFWKLQRISWTQNLSNERALKICSVERCLLKSLRRRQLQFVGHVMRKHELEHLSLTGKIDGSRARERQRETFMSQFQRSANHLLQMILKIAEHRECT